MVFILGSAFALVAFVKDLEESLFWVDRIIADYRTIYISVWRTLMEPLPSWLKPFHGEATYDALTVFTLLAATLVGRRQISTQGKTLDLLAVGALSFVFQFRHIRIREPSAFDVVVNTTIDSLVMIGCASICTWAVFFSKLSDFRRAQIAISAALAAVGTWIISIVADSTVLLWGVITGELPADLSPQLPQLRHAAVTALAFGIGGALLTAAYVRRGPRRPLIAYTLGLALALLAISFAGEVLERAFREAGWWENKH